MQYLLPTKSYFTFSILTNSSQCSFVHACSIVQQLATGLASLRTVVQNANVHMSTCGCNLTFSCSTLLEALYYMYYRIA